MYLFLSDDRERRKWMWDQEELTWTSGFRAKSSLSTMTAS